MSHKSIRRVLVDMLEDLGPPQLRMFYSRLQQRREELQVRRRAVEGRDIYHITDVLVSTFTEPGALKVALEILREIGCNEEAERLASETSIGSLTSGSSDRLQKNYGPDFHKTLWKWPWPKEEPIKFWGGSASDSQTSNISTILGGGLHSPMDDIMKNVQVELQAHLREKFTCKYEGTAASGPRLEEIHTRLYVTEKIERYGCKSHEILHQFKLPDEISSHALSWMGSHDIFKGPRIGRSIKKVMTKGIAGIGKTVAVQNFTLHWAEGKSNQHIDFIFVLPFRELNMLKEGEYSLIQLLLHFYPELKQIQDTQKLVNKQVLFIFDGLDESRFPLDFADSKRVSDIDQTSTVDVLLTNLIKGNLLPNAFLWITSRPAAANQIPPEYIDQMTEVQGFTDQQKEEFFRKRFSDANQAKEVISCLNGMMSLYFMSHIPIFCWITAEVFKKELNDQKSRMITTVTELYIHYLLIQTQQTAKKYEENRPGDMAQKEVFESRNYAMLLKLTKLAFEQLEKGNILFYEEDLRQCGIDVDKDSVFCSEILKQEYGLYQKKMFSFVHLSFQEFLAAVYMFHCCVTKNISALKSFLEVDPTDLALHELLKRVVDKALKSENGHLDLFLCFFHGVSLESNQAMLQGLLPQTENSSETVEQMKRYLRNLNAGNILPERCINLFLCKYELKEQGVQNEIQMFLQSGVRLSFIDCSVLSTMLLMSEEVIDELDLTKWHTPLVGTEKLLLPIKNCKRAVLKSRHLETKCLETLVSILKSTDSSLRELCLLCVSDCIIPLPHRLIDALRSADCKLETLRLSGFALGSEHCHSLASVPSIKTTVLESAGLTKCPYMYQYDYVHHYYPQEVEKKENDESPMTIIPSVLISPDCKLSELRMTGCVLKSKCCQVFASVLSSNSHLRELDLSHNNLQDLGVKLLSVGLGSPQCRLEILRLSGCGITEEGCASLASALSSNPSHLRELDLSYNHPGDSGVKLLSERLEDPTCRLEKLNVDQDEEHWVNPQLLNKYACELTLDPNTTNQHLVLSEGNKRVEFVEEKQPYSAHPERFDEEHQVLCREGLTGRCYWEVQWQGFVSVGLAYKSIERKGWRDVKIGFNDKAWSFSMHVWNGFSFVHKGRETFIPALVPDLETFSQPSRLGVYLDWPAGILSFYRLSSDTKTLLHTFHTTFTEPLFPVFRVYCGSLTLSKVLKWNMDSAQTNFTPELFTESANTIYRFKSPGPGVFQCTLTGLVFTMAEEGEVLYRTVQWDESLLQSAGKTPAGLLFSIQCPQDSVCQLHLPHCEIHPAPLPESLSVVHITDDGMSILQPLEITETHVGVKVPHLSAFGLVWDYIKRFLTFTKPIRSQVLLFLLPPGRKQRRKLNVFLLPNNVHLQEVKGQEENEYIGTTANCYLTEDQSYSLHCDPEEYKAQPKRAPFDLNYGPNYHPTFDILLNTSTEEVTLMVQEEEKREVWKYKLDLTACLPGPCPDRENLPRAPSLSAEERLDSARPEFIKRVSEPVLDNLLDELLRRMVINDEEMESTRTKARPDKAREVIDMVRRKGTQASSNMIAVFCERDPYLSKELNFS
ncbi:NACHT, LRR and PYD domains-containing protein 5-like isoform X2 [Centroberyx affinis]|uniref:NACHT, LRR and PYD domains-containing protein 5-like isoform X2 n=1 Tax=Centroberyx affinis TaxID=166261 RepID=UPI003A5BCDD4